VVELPPHARRLLEAARTLDDPGPERRARADAAVRDALAAHGLTNLAPLAASSSQAPAQLHSGLPWGTKLALGLGTLAIVAAGFWQLRSAPEDKPVPPPPPSAASSERQLPAPRDIALAEANADEPRTPQRLARAKTALARRPAADDDAALRAELRLLAAVDAMLRGGRHREALRTLTDSERAGKVVLAEERRALHVLALCGAGNSAAPAEREKFLARAPHSVLAERVRAACAVEP
jgi:hypothetical protein